MPRPRLIARQSFQPYCPLGGTWYVCTGNSNSVGCCINEPCSLGCKDGNIESASFNPEFYGKFPDLSCEKGGRFYTCRNPSPNVPFWGCCKTDPCNGGCQGNLTSAFLTGSQALDCQYNAGGCSTTSSSSASSTASSSSASSTASSSSASSTASPSSASSTASPSSASSTASPSSASSTASPSSASSTASPSSASSKVIAGGAVGGVAGLALIILLIFFYYRHTTRPRKKKNDESRQHSALPGIPSVTPESKHLYQELDSSPSSTFKPPTSPNHSPPPSSSILAFPSPVANNPPSTPHHPHHSSYELSAISVAPSPTGLGIYSPSAPSPGISRRPVATSPNPSELSAEEVQRRAELSSTDSVRWSPNLSHAGAGGQSPQST